MKLNIAVELPDDADPELVDGYCTAVVAIARQLFPPVWMEVNRGESNESIRGNDAGRNSVGGDNRVGIGVSDTHRHSDVCEERGVDSVRISAVGGDGDRGPREGEGVAGQPGRAESGSDRLTGPPVGITEGGSVAGSHRGRRRRLLDALKQVRRTGRRSSR